VPDQVSSGVKWRLEITLLKNDTGINYCFAKLLLENNCNVVIADLALRPEAQKLIDDYTTQPRAVFVKTNVVMWDELNNMFDIAEKEFGGADIVRHPHHRSPLTTEIS
jgi:NAD(P)-dependent dehydrogenase (short-subunit alcohol dehydrogenase family)